MLCLCYLAYFDSCCTPCRQAFLPHCRSYGKKKEKEVSFLHYQHFIHHVLPGSHQTSTPYYTSKRLDRFSSHSVRVWACVLLHTHGKSPDYIKLRLRWRSDSYKDYLRDVSMLAIEHADVIHQAVTTLNAS